MINVVYEVDNIKKKVSFDISDLKLERSLRKSFEDFDMVLELVGADCLKDFIEGKSSQNFISSQSMPCFTETEGISEAALEYSLLNVSIIPKGEIFLRNVDGDFKRNYLKSEKIFNNGYQSWTDTREFDIDETMTDYSRLAKTRLMENRFAFWAFGDYSFIKYKKAPGCTHGWSYTYIREGDSLDFYGSLNEDTGYTCFAHSTREGRMKIIKDLNVRIDKPYLLFEIFHQIGSEEKVFDQYFKCFYKSVRGRGYTRNSDCIGKNGEQLFGYTSWYNYYQDINEEKILKNINAIDSSKYDFTMFQIDDGFEEAVGDWLLIDKAKFPNGLKPLVEKIHQGGLKAGIWLAPFVCEKKSRLFKEHPDWIVKKDNGRMIKSGGNWSGHYPLNLEMPEVREYIKKVLKLYSEEYGFDLFKLDFLYAASILPSEGKSRGQKMFEAMSFLRECLGDKLILGCGVPLAPAFGAVDYCRIGPDVGLDEDGTALLRLINRERVSTKNTILNTTYRRQLNGRAFGNDPDVFLLREDIKLNDEWKEKLITVNKKYGAVMFTSDNVDDYNEKQWEIFNRALHL